MKALILKTDGTMVLEQIDKGIRAKQEIVSGDIECISLDRNFRMQMFINETGKFDHLLINELATKVFRSFFETEDWIAGNAVICGCDDEGESCDLTDEQIQEIKAKLESEDK